MFAMEQRAPHPSRPLAGAHDRQALSTADTPVIGRHTASHYNNRGNCNTSCLGPKHCIDNVLKCQVLKCQVWVL